MLLDTAVSETARIMNICNACRYCEGHCAVFPAAQQLDVLRANQGSMGLIASSSDATMQRQETSQFEYLAHLCHSCGACFRHCQYTAPHEFDINVPKVLELVRQDSFEALVRPAILSGAVTHPIAFNTAVVIGSLLALCLGIGFDELTVEPAGDFYAVIPHQWMATIFSTAAVAVLFCWGASATRFWHELELPAPHKIPIADYAAAFTDAIKLKNLGGGHELGCYDASESPSLLKRRMHHLTVAGFMLCFLATCLGTVYHYFLDLPAPYDWLAAPKLVGTAGGVLLTLGTAGLMAVSIRTDARLKVKNNAFGDCLTLLLFLTATSGLALALSHDSHLLGLLLAIHLAIVLGLFVNFGCGKFTHALYRGIALLKSQVNHSEKVPPSAR